MTWRHYGGSHCVFIRPDGRTLPVPAHRPIKPVYIKKFLRLVAGE
ncbi:MAG: type II toxin-antitoxin system HicA family toxin [Acidithiobacillus ferrooxidans]